MAKKSRRVRRKGTQTRLSEAQLVQPTQVAEQAPPVKEAAATEQPQQTDEIDLRKEYQYVTSDLKRLGILAMAILGGILFLYAVV